MTTLADGLWWTDLRFLDKPRAIATAIFQAPDGLAVIDPGPTSCLATLECGLRAQGAALGDVRDVLLTHIHLDHAGAAGVIAQRHPEVRVWVHERGAPHLVAPDRLIESATRLYGAEMDRLWGQVIPVPSSCVRILRGGERLTTAGRTLEVAYTPGHASHHVSYWEPDSGIAFVGDVAGVRIDGGYVLPPTPPPDIDLDAWDQSLRRVETWHPLTLFLTHFGPVLDVAPHLHALRSNLRELSDVARASLQDDRTDAARSAAFAAHVRRRLEQSGQPLVAEYGAAAPLEQQWFGLARYWRKRA